MIVHPPDLARLLLEGRKTHALRRVRPGEIACPLRPGSRHAVERRMYEHEILEAGYDVLHAVKAGRVAHPTLHVGFVIVGPARRARLGDLSFADIARQGYRSSAAFKRDQVASFDGLWRHRMLTLPEGHPGKVDVDDEGVVLARFDCRHADREVWVFEAQVDRADEPRYLAIDSSVGYVRHRHDYRGRRVAMRDEPEPVDDRTLAGFAKEAEAACAEQRAKRVRQLAALPLHERVRLLEQRSGTVDLGGDLRQIRHRLTRAERRLDAR